MPSLSPAEVRLILLFRSLSPAEQRAIEAVAETLCGAPSLTLPQRAAFVRKKFH